MMTDQEIIDVVTAHKEGKTLQYHYKGNDNSDYWCDVSFDSDGYNFDANDYRVKPEPFECWVNVYRHTSSNRAHETEKSARDAANSPKRTAVHMREITDD